MEERQISRRLKLRLEDNPDLVALAALQVVVRLAVASKEDLESSSKFFTLIFLILGVPLQFLHMDQEARMTQVEAAVMKEKWEVTMDREVITTEIVIMEVVVETSEEIEVALVDLGEIALVQETESALILAIGTRDLVVALIIVVSKTTVEEVIRVAVELCITIMEVTEAHAEEKTPPEIRGDTLVAESSLTIYVVR